MFLTISSKISFDKSKTIFFYTQNYLIKTHKFCVYVYEREQSITNLSFTFYLKINLGTYKLDTTLLENLLLLLDLVQTMI